MNIPLNIDYTPSPEELAVEFCELGEDEQARFFNQVAKTLKESSLSMQLEFISQSKLLTSDGRWVMQQIGSYGGHNYD